MSLFAIGDLHLSLAANKSMEVFPGWENYVERIRTHWTELVKESDTVVVAGDTSWAMSLENTKADFNFIHQLPGEKIILKGNHDYWWTTKTKMDNFFVQEGLHTLNILHNNYYAYDTFAICGTRGWINDNSEPADAKVLAREAARLDMSVTSAEQNGLKPIVFLHYPPVYANECNYEILDVLYKHSIQQCFYGHIHGKGASYAVNGVRDGIQYTLISSDYMKFIPLRIM